MRNINLNSEHDKTQFENGKAKKPCKCLRKISWIDAQNKKPQVDPIGYLRKNLAPEKLV